MKRKFVALTMSILMGAMVLTGCQASQGLENDYIKISKYKEVEVDKIDDVAEVTDQDVADRINEILDDAKTPVEVTDRAAKDGDTVNVDFVGKINGKEFQGGTESDYDLTIGSGMYLEGFEECIIGHEIGDTWTFKCTFPDDYSRTEYAGRDATFKITLNKITEYEYPELDDDFVKSVSEESTTVEEYMKEIKADLEAENERAHQDELGNEVWTEVVANTTIKELPEEDTDEMRTNLISRYTSLAEEAGYELKDYVVDKMGYESLDSFESAVDSAVTQYVEQTCIAEAIADKEGIEVTDELYEQELQHVIDNYGSSYGYETVEDLKENEDEDSLHDVVLRNLVEQWLADHCIQVASTDTTNSSTTDSSATDSSATDSSATDNAAESTADSAATE